MRRHVDETRARPGVCVHAVARRRSRGNQASRERLGKYSGPWRAKEEKPCPESDVPPELFLLSCSPLDVITEDSGERANGRARNLGPHIQTILFPLRRLNNDAH